MPRSTDRCRAAYAGGLAGARRSLRSIDAACRVQIETLQLKLNVGEQHSTKSLRSFTSICFSFICNLLFHFPKLFASSWELDTVRSNTSLSSPSSIIYYIVLCCRLCYFDGTTNTPFTYTYLHLFFCKTFNILINYYIFSFSFWPVTCDPLKRNRFVGIHRLGLMVTALGSRLKGRRFNSRLFRC